MFLDILVNILFEFSFSEKRQENCEPSWFQTFTWIIYRSTLVYYYVPFKLFRQLIGLEDWFFTMLLKTISVFCSRLFPRLMEKKFNELSSQ